MRPGLHCVGCDRAPSEIGEYISAAVGEKHLDGTQMTPDEYAWEEEGTLNTSTGEFLCTACYIRAGMPTSPTGWTVPSGWVPDFRKADR